MVRPALAALGVALGAAGCGTEHVEFPTDLDAQAQDGTTTGPHDGGGVPLPDGGTCVPNDAADCAGYCGSRIGRCGVVIDCGSCPAGLSCGAGGPNLCGHGTCVPACGAGIACGANDGCGGTCASGTCGAGQRCSAGKCICDATSCSGCCTANTCGTCTPDAGPGPGKCTDQCTTNAQCQAWCAPVASGVNCCDKATSVCYQWTSSSCPI